MRSIVQREKECLACRMIYRMHNPYIEEHHVFFGNGRRKVSERLGLKVWLCPEHHRGTDGVHGKNGHELDLYLKRLSQTAYEAHAGTRTDFIREIGKNYL